MEENRGAVGARHSHYVPYVEDGVKDLAQGMYSGPSGSFRSRDMGSYVGPLGIGEVGLVCTSHARYFTELLSQDPFSDSFSTLDFSHSRRVANGVG